MIHLHMDHGVCLKVLHEIVGKRNSSSCVDVIYTPTDDMNADIFTKVVDQCR